MSSFHRFEPSHAIVALLAMTMARGAGAQTPDAACTRVALGTWTPPLDWSRAGHRDSTGAVSAHVRRLRDSIFAAGGGVGERESMLWIHEQGERRLLLYPAWWPAGVIVRFTQPALGDTLIGEARALVADLSEPVSRAAVRVITSCRREPDD